MEELMDGYGKESIILLIVAVIMFIFAIIFFVVFKDTNKVLNMTATILLLIAVAIMCYLQFYGKTQPTWLGVTLTIIQVLVVVLIGLIIKLAKIDLGNLIGIPIYYVIGLILSSNQEKLKDLILMILKR